MSNAQANYLADMDIGNDSEIIDDGDRLGGSSILESGVYLFTINEAYIGEANSGAKCMNLVLETADKQILRSQQWMTSGKSKGCKAFYIVQATGDKHYLPGYVIAKNISMLVADGKSPNNLVIETRQIMKYDAEAKKEVPTSVPMCIELIGKQILGAVTKTLVDKTKKSGTVDASGKEVYIPTGETRYKNDLVKVFRPRDKKTVTEILAQDGAPEGVFIAKWKERFDGKTEDKTSKVSGHAGAPGSPMTGNAGTPASPEVSGLFQ